MVNFKSLVGISNTLKFLYSSLLVLIIVGIFSDYLQLQLLKDALIGNEITDEMATSNDLRQHVIAILTLILNITTYVLFFIWFYRAYYNLPMLGAKNLEYTPGRAVGNFFIPFINLVKPYNGMRDIWDWSWDDKEDIIHTKSNTIISIWWGLFLLTNIVSQFLLRKSASDTIEGLISTTNIYIYSAIPDILLVVVTFYLVTKITGIQSLKYEKIKMSSPTANELLNRTLLNDADFE